MNKVILIGNLTKDPELTTTSSGISVCRFVLAVKRPFSQGDTDFFNVTAWRALGERVDEYCSKGERIAVSGHIQLRSYDDNKGNKHITADIIAAEVEFLSSRK